MAATTLLKFQGEQGKLYAFEIWSCVIGPAETNCDITPTYLSSVEFVTITACDAASAATLIGYLDGSTYVPGGKVVSIVGANSTTYLVKLEGKTV